MAKLQFVKFFLLCIAITTIAVPAKAQTRGLAQQNAEVIWTADSTPPAKNFTPPMTMSPAPSPSLSPSPDEAVEPASKNSGIWDTTGSVDKTVSPPTVDLSCLVEKSLELEIERLFEAVKSLYLLQGWKKQLEDITSKEPKDCARNIALFRISIARQVLKELASK